MIYDMAASSIAFMGGMHNHVILRDCIIAQIRHVNKFLLLVRSDQIYV